MKNILFFILILILSSCITNKENQVVTEVNVDGRKIPVIHFDNLHDEVLETGISELIDDYKVIPLETKEECLVGNTRVFLFNENIIVGTQIDFPGPVTCYMFDDTGKFIKEVGGRGAGPGEHTGYLLSSMLPLIDTNMFVLNFTTENQLFNSNAEYVCDIKQPFDLMGNAISYSGDIWYSPGSLTGHPNYPRDSVYLVMHDRDGKIFERINRVEYPPSPEKGFTPAIGGRSLYINDDRWIIYSAGNDTVYSISGKSIVPEYILDRGVLGHDYNKIVEPESVIGENNFSVVAETDDCWIINCSEITEADINEYRPGRWSGSYNMRYELAIIYKEKNKSVRIEAFDDIYELVDKRNFNSQFYFNPGNTLVFALQAPDVKRKIAEKLESTDIGPEQKNRLEELDSQINENSNPVVFIFYLKDEFDFD